MLGLPVSVKSKRGVVTWSLSPKKLLPSGGGDYWTEHSERHGLVSFAAALKVSKEEHMYIGRWPERNSSISSAGEYV